MPEYPLPERWSRVNLVYVKPRVDGGRWPARRSIGEEVEVEAGLILDGHDKIAAEMLYRYEDEPERSVRMKLRWNDEYVAAFPVERLGRYYYRVRAWVDQFATWQDQFERRVKGGDTEYEIRSELQAGAQLLRRAAEQAKGTAKKQLLDYADAFEAGDVEAGRSPAALELARANDPRVGLVESENCTVVADPALARFAAWYEFFPRSAGEPPLHHATLDEAAERLPRIKELGYDVVYLPPVHPIGLTNRKGKDNAPTAQPGEPGSPWAIGGDEGGGVRGGHKSVHSELGGIEAFDRFVARAESLGLKVALDIAYQASPDHPYVHDHPDWFARRPDGTVRYAENPPKKYQDVHPFDFESPDWENLWQELKSVFEFWIDHGVRIFRVDNPHTKPFAFWEWCIGSLRAEHPDLIFLAEAFSRPKIMYQLARLGFNNSYTYFTWRNTKDELVSYCEELFQTEVAEYFRPNFWPNTPDILHDYLVHGGRPAHVIRFVLAATLSSAYGVYGPPYEHVDNEQHPKREEYANNEKYEIRTWNWHDPHSLQRFMRRVNRIRQENPALHFMRNLRFQRVENEGAENQHLLAYTKQHGDNLLLVVVNLDPYHGHDGWVHLPLEDLDLPEDHPYEVHDLLGGGHYYWQGAWNYVRLDPHVMPAHIFRIHYHQRTERDFPTFA